MHFFSKLLQKNLFFIMTSCFLMLFVVFLPRQTDKNTTQATQKSEPDNHTKVFTPDWGVAGTLVAMNHQPYATAEIDNYKIWANNPPLPKGIKDVGLRYFPNMEMLKIIKPDVIIDIDFYELLRPLYNKNIPIVTTNLGRERTDIFTQPKWQDFKPSLLAISQHINPEFDNNTHQSHRAFIENYLDVRKKRIEMAGKRIRKKLGNNKQYAVVAIRSTRSVSFTADNSMTFLSMQMMGLPMFYRGKPNKWGVAQNPMQVLLELPKDTCLIITKPFSPFFKYQLKTSLIWQKSAFSKADACIYTIDSVWSTSGVEAVVNFAEHLAHAVETNDNSGLVLDDLANDSSLHNALPHQSTDSVNHSAVDLSNSISFNNNAKTDGYQQKANIGIKTVTSKKYVIEGKS